MRTARVVTPGRSGASRDLLVTPRRAHGSHSPQGTQPLPAGGRVALPLRPLPTHTDWYAGQPASNSTGQRTGRPATGRARRALQPSAAASLQLCSRERGAPAGRPGPALCSAVPAGHRSKTPRARRYRALAPPAATPVSTERRPAVLLVPCVGRRRHRRRATSCRRRAAAASADTIGAQRPPGPTQVGCRAGPGESRPCPAQRPPVTRTPLVRRCPHLHPSTSRPTAASPLPTAPPAPAPPSRGRRRRPTPRRGTAPAPVVTLSRHRRRRCAAPSVFGAPARPGASPPMTPAAGRRCRRRWCDAASSGPSSRARWSARAGSTSRTWCGRRRSAGTMTLSRTDR